MGDYTLGYFKFQLKRDTPKEVKETLRAFVVDGKSFMIGDEEIYYSTSAYHDDENFAEIKPAQDYGGWCYHPTEGDNYTLRFQMKYGCGKFKAFAEWLEPHVVVDKANAGWYGHSISEYSDTPTVFIAKESKND